MQSIKNSVKSALNPQTISFLKHTLDFFTYIPDWPSVTFHNWQRDSVKRLMELKDLHRGERCFLIGNGPSINKMDLSKLREEYTICTNKFFLAFPELGYETTYYLTVNDLIAEQSSLEIQAPDMIKFVSWRMRKLLKPSSNLICLYTTHNGEKFSKDVSGRVWEGGTVTYVRLQLAYHLGFSEVILIGVDHNYHTKGKPNETVISQGNDLNHFHSGYFGKGYRWQLPDLKNWENAYKLARTEFENSGRYVFDATVDGKLLVFPKINYDSL